MLRFSLHLSFGYVVDVELLSLVVEQAVIAETKGAIAVSFLSLWVADLARLSGGLAIAPQPRKTRRVKV